MLTFKFLKHTYNFSCCSTYFYYQLEFCDFKSCLAQNIFIFTFLSAIYWFFFSPIFYWLWQQEISADILILLRILAFILKCFFVSFNTQEFCCCQAHFVFMLWRKQHIPYTKVLLVQNREQVSGQTRSFLFDTVQIILTSSLLFPCAGVRFFPLSAWSQMQSPSLRDIFCLSFYLRELSSKCSWEKWSTERSSPSQSILDTCSYHFHTTRSHLAKKPNQQQ